jgi:AraC-like DNA-binding protein
LLPKLAADEMATEKWGGNGPVTRIICGYFGCERHAQELFLNGLPAVLKLHVRGNPAGVWIESAIRHSAGEIEAQRPGRTAVLSRLAEALFMETLCRYMEGLPPGHRSWLAAARDPKVGKALALLHRDPAHPWTLATLAQASGVSRSVLAGRFSELMGETPLAYLARWRLQLAARRLLTSDAKVLQVAYEVGYESEAAFSRAFKRAFGVPPARYRRERVTM